MADAPTQTPQRPDAARETATIELPPVDVRRKRPPALAFLLRLETLRKALRVVSLLALDLVGVFAAIYVALMVKAVAALRRLGVARVLRRGARERRVRLAGHGAAVRALRPVRVARRAPGPVADRLVAVPGDASSRWCSRSSTARSTPATTSSTARWRSRSASSARCAGRYERRHRLAAARRRLPPPRGARRLRQAHRGRRARADRRGARAGRDGRLHLAHAAARQRAALARPDRGPAGGARRATASRR